MRLRRTRLLVPTALVAAGAGLAGCGHHPARDVADPFAHGISGARVIISRVTCQPTPDTCERVVVLAPSGTQQAELLRLVESRLASTLGWRPTRAREVVEPDEGDVFDAKSSRHGGSVNPAPAQLRYWQRTGWGQEVPPDPAEVAIQRATRATPSAIVITIM